MDNKIAANDDVNIDSVEDFLAKIGVQYTAYPHPSKMTDEQLKNAPPRIKQNALKWRSKNKY